MAVETLYASNTGRVSLSQNGTYLACHDAASGSAVNSTSWVWACGQGFATPDLFTIYRGCLVFPALEKIGVISAATLSLMFKSDIYQDATTFNITLVSGVDLEDTFVAADYGDLVNEIIAYAPVLSTSGLVNEVYYDFVLNATAITYMNLAAAVGGKFRFAIRCSDDIDSVEPSQYSRVSIYGNTVDKKPTLVVTYIPDFIPRVFII